MMKVQISVRPKSPLGKWSVGLAAALILLLVLPGILARLDGVGTGPGGPILYFTFGILGIATLVTGLISTIKSKERSILVFLSVAVGLLVSIFLLDLFIYIYLH